MKSYVVVNFNCYHGILKFTRIRHFYDYKKFKKNSDFLSPHCLLSPRHSSRSHYAPPNPTCPATYSTGEASPATTNLRPACSGPGLSPERVGDVREQQTIPRVLSRSDLHSTKLEPTPVKTCSRHDKSFFKRYRGATVKPPFVGAAFLELILS